MDGWKEGNKKEGKIKKKLKMDMISLTKQTMTSHAKIIFKKTLKNKLPINKMSK